MSFGHGRWYLQSLEQDGVSFVAGRSFTAAYTTTATSVTWTTSSNCTQSGTNSPVTITCSQPGVETMTVYRNGDTTTTDTFYVTLVKAAGCYKWYISAGTQNVVSAGSSISALVWIVDPKTISSAEAAGTGSAPSAVSKSLTTSFTNVGEIPQIQFTSSGISLSSNLTWNSSNGYWQASISAPTAGSYPFSISGNAVSIMGCSVEPFLAALFVKASVSSIWQTSAIAASSGQTSFKMISSACVSNLLVASSSLYGSANLAVSQSAFLVASEAVLSKSFNIDSNGVSTAALNALGLFILTGSAGHLINLSSSSTSTSTGLPASFSAAASATICSTETISLNNHVVVWNQIAGAYKIYASTDGGATFITIDLSSSLSASSTAIIRNVLVSQNAKKYVLIVRDSVSDKVFLVDPFTMVISSAYVFGASTNIIDSGQGAWPFIVEGPGFLLFGGDTLYLSPDFGSSVFAFTIQSRNPSLPAYGLASGEYLTQAVVSPDGSALAVLTSSMRVFYGSPALYTMLEVSAGISTGSLAVLGFDSAQRLLIYQPSSSSNYVTSRVVSIPNEMQSPRAPTASNPTLVCPYSSWVSSMQSRYTVDIGESASFAINVTTLGATSGDVLFSFSNYSLISVTTASSKSTISDPFGSSNPIWVTTTNLTINPTSIALLGDSIITVRPKEENLACNKINGQAAVTVGCSNTRVMVLRPPSAVAPTIGQIISQNVCTHAPTSVLLAAGSWISDWTSFSRPNYDKYISYNCSLYGPPIDLYYGEVFSPAFDLYDQGVFVKRVTANIGLWDVNGRAFQFNMTNGDAGCTGPAQTWFGMVASTSNPSLAWNSTNYVPCFTSVGPVDRTSQYTIFNASNGLGIVWSGGYNGVFMITATVLDPSYSYCPLSANFAINVYGAPLPAWTQAGIIIGMTLVFLFVLTMSYFLQLRDRKRNAIKIDLDQGDEEYNSKESSGVLWKAKLE